MAACLHIVGLGPAGLDQMTVGTYKRLQRAEKVIVRTAQHPCVRDLRDEGIIIDSFDEVYASKESFEEVYEEIIQRLQQELEYKEEVIYAVPGHPSVAEKTVQLIWQRLAGQVDIVIHSAASFLDEIFRAIPFDPIDGVTVLNYDSLSKAAISGREWLIIPQVYSQLIASEVKLDLMKWFPDTAEAYVVRALGTEEQTVARVPLFELDHQQFDHLATIVVPPNADAVSWVRLLGIMERLRSAEGCPWDMEQTHETLKRYLLEESYEVIQAIDNQDMYNLCEELGDLLLQVVFHAQIAGEAGEFDAQDVLQGIIEKMIRRHPHVFGEGDVRNSGEVIEVWEKIKQEEKQGINSEQDYFGQDRVLPALMRAAASQRKAAQLGFDWPDYEGPLAKIYEELSELKEALRVNEGIKEEFGDILFAMVNLSRFLDVDAELALAESVLKFKKRFAAMLVIAQAEGVDFKELSLEDKDRYWEKVKTAEKSGKVAGVS